MLKATFVDLSNNFYDKHAIYSLSAVLESKGIAASYVKGAKNLVTIKRIKSIGPDFLLYSALSNNIQFYLEFDEFAKKYMHVKSVIGGPGPTFGREAVEASTIDAICIGEGEYALPEYISGGFSKARNIVPKGGALPEKFYPLLDLDKIPFPRRDVVYRSDRLLKYMETKQFLSGRGCPYACTYCHNHVFNNMFKEYGPIVRKKSVDYLIEEIMQVKKNYPLRLVVFQDDTFILKRPWLEEFAGRFPAEVGLPYTCNVRANLVTEDIVKMLKKSGCIGINWSIESGNEFFRNTLLKRNIGREKIIETGRLFNKYKMPNRVANLVGLPGEKFEEMLETLELNIEARPYYGLANIFIPFPGLEITDYAVNNNYLQNNNGGALPKNFYRHSMLVISPTENEKIQKFTYLFPFLVHFPYLYRNRRIFKFLFLMPKFMLNIVFRFIDLYKMSKLYNVRVSLQHKVAIVLRYLENI